EPRTMPGGSCECQRRGQRVIHLNRLFTHAFPKVFCYERSRRLSIV
ncbi:MAG: hypothetical protein AVDCRST_MAG93-6496, partial [uncultured Chloroflexia bacterium]